MYIFNGVLKSTLFALTSINFDQKLKIYFLIYFLYIIYFLFLGHFSGETLREMNCPCVKVREIVGLPTLIESNVQPVDMLLVLGKSLTISKSCFFKELKNMCTVLNLARLSSKTGLFTPYFNLIFYIEPKLL